MRIAQQNDAADRRRSTRNTHIIEAWLSSYGSSDRVEMTNFDMSRHGVSFDATIEAPVGGHYIYEIGWNEQTLVCDIRIVNCKSIGNGIWHMGAEFI